MPTHLITRRRPTAPFAPTHATSQVLPFGESGRVITPTVLKGCCAASLMLLLSSCGSLNLEKDQQSYEVTEPVSSLVIDAQTGEVTVKAGEGPVQVTETHHYSKDKPRTSHQVDGSTLRLTESGCTNDELHCSARFDVRVPATTAVEIRTDAGAIRLTNLSGDITVVTDAGAVEGRDLSGHKVSVTTQAGATSLHFAQPPTDVRATTELGAILVQVPRGTPYAVNVSTEVGGAQVRVMQDPSSQHKISARTEVGGIRVENA